MSAPGSSAVLPRDAGEPAGSGDAASAAAPHPLLIEPIVRRALEEDLGRAGDLTTDLLIPSGRAARAAIVAHEDGVVCGLVAAEIAFRLIDPGVHLQRHVRDSEPVSAGMAIASLEGPARGILTAERVALNFLGHVSGIATSTRALVTRIAGTRARIICTRKTVPGLRLLQKYAVRCGGGLNHRFGLDDAILVKDNHIAAAGGLGPVMSHLKNQIGPMVKVEVEVDTLDQLNEALALGFDAILLDNMSVAAMRQAVELTRGRAKLEASGGITLERVRAVAETGVDFISSGALTHSVRSLDLGMNFL
jgi:nicotinate-nucleotide pyrophosphorylase (carboxylating)